MPDARRPRPKKAAPSPDPSPSTADDLRGRAEERLVEIPAASPAPEDPRDVVHELQVHQVELELQNEELRRTQLELDAERAKYLDLFELAPVGYLTLSDTGVIGDANLTAVLLLGAESRHLVGRPFSDFVLAADQDDYHLHRTLLARTGEPQSCELRLRRRDAEPFWALLEWQSQLAADGEPITSRVTLTDVNERKQAVEQLRISEERHRLIAENALDVIWTMSPVGAITYVSPSVETLRGFTVAEAMAQPLEETLTPESAAVSVGYFTYMLGEIAAGRRPEDFRGEEEYLHRDGSTVWCDVMAYPILSPDGALVELLGVSRDLRERKRFEIDLLRARDATAAANAELAEAQRLAHVGSWTWDLASDVITWSDEMFAILGVDAGGPAPPFADLARFTDPETFARAREAVSRTVETGELADFEMDIRRPDGVVRHVVARSQASPGSHGTIVGFRGSFADVTELREAQARLDQARRLEMVSRLAGGVAHDFNNLLVVINGYADFLAEGLPEDDPKRADAEAIRDAGGRAAALTAELLAFGRGQVLQPTVLDVRDAVAWVAPLLYSAIGGDVEIDIRHGEPGERIRVDRTRFEQVIVNLALNARDAMPGGGRLTIETGCVVIDAGDRRLRAPGEPGEYVRISVTDNGTGIAPDVLPRVFEPFFTTKEFGAGSGLGLASVEGIVAQSGGFITVESEVGTGTTFSVFLPRTLKEPTIAPPPHGRPAIDRRRPPQMGRETVLVVEDEPGVLAVTARGLRELGYTVLNAGDPTAAIAIAEGRQAPFDILLTDVVMPGMSGRELADRLIGLRPGLPVLFMSGYAPEKVFGEGLLDEGTPFLHKPFSREDLASRVRELLDRQVDRQAVEAG